MHSVDMPGSCPNGAGLACFLLPNSLSQLAWYLLVSVGRCRDPLPAMLAPFGLSSVPFRVCQVNVKYYRYVK